MQAIEEPQTLARAITCAGGGRGRVGFVPTMGNLHDGHLSLVEQCREHSDCTVVSIFVNPFQFSAGEDLDQYPRTLAADLDKLEAAGVDVVFLPTVECLYPRGLEHTATVEVPALAGLLCGRTRPSFFRGVCTVVNILLNIVRPDDAYFGEKDYQQLLIIRRMVEDLRMGVRIDSGVTVREADGLAMSSRNSYLSSAQRRTAPCLHQTLDVVAKKISQGIQDYEVLSNEALDTLRAEGFEPDYLEVLDAADLSAPSPDCPELRVLAAARLGETRLIDNVGVSLAAIPRPGATCGLDLPS
ncbi:MAG: pantoate--beta-alanine ligase [Thiotrichales bacterium]|nr:pantoate--beta-alanine ligase [Thiotrichales bacterium]